MARVKKVGLLICLFLLCTGCDLSTKLLALKQLQDHQPIQIVSNFIELRYTENDAVAFSLLRSVPLSGRKVIIYSTSLVALVLLGAFLWQWRRRSAIGLAPLLLILSGAIGNLVDRWTHGYVIDFIHIHYGDLWSWPVFNMADVWISFGVGLLFFTTRRTKG